jgi:membrane-bound ClpP family serine protease
MSDERKTRPQLGVLICLSGAGLLFVVASLNQTFGWAAMAGVALMLLSIALLAAGNCVFAASCDPSCR